MIEYRTYTDDLLPGIVTFWNRVFADRRNFFRVTEGVFRARVVDKRTAIERFEPARFWLALEGGAVVGLAHAGVRPEELCRVLQPDWPGGSQGYVALFVVAPETRRRGGGNDLWRRVHESLAGTKQVILDGQCINPFYGNSEGPLTPFWGTPEGISVPWSDSATKKFFARRGFAPRYKAVQMEIDPRAAAVEEVAGFEIRISSAHYPDIEKPYGAAPRYDPPGPFECAAVIVEERTVGLLSWFPLADVGPGRFAIYEALVSEKARGKGAGRALLMTALRRMRESGATSCDVLTIPEVSDAAFRLYESAGFRAVEGWAVY